MPKVLQKIPFIIELFFNGLFILLYSLKETNRLPAAWDIKVLDTAMQFCAYLVPLVVLISVVTNFILCKRIELFLRKYIFSVLIIIPLMMTWGDVEFAFWLVSAHLLSLILSLYDVDTLDKVKNSFSFKSFMQVLRLKPAQLVILSFMAVIFIGTFVLMLPPSLVEGKTLSFSDALFMATSATCVTGLSTMSLQQDFTLFGQMVILLLIQVGGLGIMTLSTSMTILLGRSMRMKDRIIMQDLLDVSSLEDLFAMIINIIQYTFLIELWGAIVLTFAFIFEGYEFGTSIYYGFFHSISAFCNAGFALFDNSLESYATSPLIHGTISVLVILGGLGFIVLKEVSEMVMSGGKIVRMALHSKIVITTSIILTVGGALFIFFGEFLNALDGYTLVEKIQVAFFQSVTLRTAGFNTIPLTSFNSYTLYGMSLIMFIGASPGSTGGGVKTTTLAILIQSIKSTFKGVKTVTILDRTVPSPIVVRATALTFISIIITSIFILLLMKLEPGQTFLPIFFEVVSASGTVGLSLGVTSQLSIAGKGAISLLMLIGRIGPLTLLLAIGGRDRSTGKIDYPDGRIMIG